MSNERTYVVGIDIGTHMTRVVVTEPPTGEKMFPALLAVGKSPTEGMRHGYIVHPEEVAQSVTRALRAAEQTLGESITAAYVAIGGVGLSAGIVTGSHTVITSTLEVTEQDINELVRSCEQTYVSTYKNRRVLHTIPLWYKVDGEHVFSEDPVGMHGTRIETKVLCVSCFKHHYRDLIKVIESVGIEILGVIAAPIALSVATLSRKQRVSGCALVDIGAETVSLAVFENDALISLEIFAIGSAHITNDLALGLSIPITQAEDIKLGKDTRTFPKKKIEDMIEARLADIFESVQNHLKDIRRSELLPAGVIIAGGSARIPGIENVSRSTLRLPAMAAKIEHILPGRRDLDSAWLTAYGLCMLGEPSLEEPSGIRVFFKSISQSVRRFFEQFIP